MDRLPKIIIYNTKQMGILADREIASLSRQGMITPYHENQIKVRDNIRRLSFGQSSYGYDLTLSDAEFLVYDIGRGGVVDPKFFSNSCLREIELCRDDEPDQAFYVLPPHTYALGVTAERIKMPDYITGIAIGKSTYARCGLILNCTPIEAGWVGHITLEMYNSNNLPLRVYAREGICQLLFLRGEKCNTTYGDRNGKYQNQPHEVVLPKI